MVPPPEAFLPPSPSNHSLYPPACFSAARLYTLSFMCGPVCVHPLPTTESYEKVRSSHLSPVSASAPRTAPDTQGALNKYLRDWMNYSYVYSQHQQWAKEKPRFKTQKPPPRFQAPDASCPINTTPGWPLPLTNPHWLTLDNGYKNSLETC